jgi:zinc/manganese transport system substrate-binding protein/manganese/iron transport system substrate-binding protein
MRRLTSLLLLIAFAWLLAGCGDDESSAAGSDQLQVVATTTQVADLARNVAGGRAEVRGLLGPNVDPHDHEIRPSDLDGLSEARVVLQSGGDLDAWLDEAVRSAGGSPTVIELADAIRPAGPADDPHWWQDPRNAMAVVKVIRDALAKADPPDAGAYKAAADAYLRELESLDSAIAACMQAIPREARKLVTTHDALGYYADRYGVEVHPRAALGW